MGADSSCRATSIRRSCSPAARQLWPAPMPCSPTTDGPPGPHLQPRPRRAAQHRSRRAAGNRRSRQGTHRAMTEDRTAVVLMGYGTPRTPADILPYYTDIRRGHPPTDEQLADLTARYEAIGGISPLAERTEAQRQAMQAALDRLADGKYHVTLGMKHAAAVHRGGRRRTRRAGVPSRRRHGAGAALLGVLGRPVPRPADHRRHGARHRRHRHRELGDRAGLRRVRRRGGARHASPACPTRPGCLFTAHSLPERILETGDPYPSQLRATAECVASTARSRQLGRGVAERRAHARAVAAAPTSWT